MSILSGLIVSIDAFFIGLSLGLQGRYRYMYLVATNLFLMGLCFIGFFVAGHVYEVLPFDPDILVGFAFIMLGLWTIIQFFLCEYIQKRNRGMGKHESNKIFVLIGLVMSLEAMLITMGIAIVFYPGATLFIPLSVALAHFGYSTISFFMARTRRVRKIPNVISHVISGIALIIYGLMALFAEFGI